MFFMLININYIYVVNSKILNDMKKSIFSALCLVLLATTTQSAWGQSVGDVLWGENFAHFGTNTPSKAGTGTGTTIYGSASISYNQSSTNTKGYNEKLAGGTAPELLLAKSNTTWTISGIPTAGATKMLLEFKSNKTTFSLSSSTTGISISGSGKSWTITNTTAITFELVLKNTGSSNARIDDIQLTIQELGSTPPTVYLGQEMELF